MFGCCSCHLWLRKYGHLQTRQGRGKTPWKAEGTKPWLELNNCPSGLPEYWLQILDVSASTITWAHSLEQLYPQSRTQINTSGRREQQCRPFPGSVQPWTIMNGTLHRSGTWGSTRETTQKDTSPSSCRDCGHFLGGALGATDHPRSGQQIVRGDQILVL